MIDHVRIQLYRTKLAREVFRLSSGASRGKLTAMAAFISALTMRLHPPTHPHTCMHSRRIYVHSSCVFGTLFTKFVIIGKYLRRPRTKRPTSASTTMSRFHHCTVDVHLTRENDKNIYAKPEFETKNIQFWFSITGFL